MRFAIVLLVAAAFFVAVARCQDPIATCSFFTDKDCTVPDTESVPLEYENGVCNTESVIGPTQLNFTTSSNNGSFCAYGPVATNCSGTPVGCQQGNNGDCLLFGQNYGQCVWTVSTDTVSSSDTVAPTDTQQTTTTGPATTGATTGPATTGSATTGDEDSASMIVAPLAVLVAVCSALIL